MSTTLEYTSRPGLMSAYKKIFFGGRASYKGLDSLPQLEALWNQALDSPEQIQKYREICGFKNDGNLPILYPHIMTFAMQIHMLADKRFPLKAFGAVTTRSHIHQRRAIAETEALDLKCFFSGVRIVKAGLEVDLTTTATSEGQVVWESVNAYLFRGKKFGEVGEAHPWSSFSDLGEESDFEDNRPIPKKLGRRYAKVTGDFNPIHNSRILAKIFGFKLDIIHGMWSFARCVTALPEPGIDGPQRLDIAFKGPVFMESSCALTGEDQDGVKRFNLFCGKNPRPILLGSLTACSEEDTLIES